MTQATNTSLGEIKLAGDLSGNNNGLAPELSATGVTAGSYTLPSITVDSKGRISSASNSSSSVVTALIPNASDTVKGIANFPTSGSLVVVDGAVSVPDASTSVKGVASFDDTYFNVSAGAVTFDINSLPTATGSVFGVVKSGTNITNTAGVLSVADATTSVKGVASFNSGQFAVTSGAVSVNTQGLDVATGSTFGVVKSGTNITNTAGVLSVAEATGSVFGVVKSGTNITNTAGVLSVADASTSVKGIASFDDTYFNVTAGAVTLDVAALPVATGSVFGIVKSGTNITNTAGVLSIETATGSVFGVVKSGANITNTAGVLSIADATTSVKGVASFDPAYFSVASGVVSFNTAALPIATDTVFGLVKSGSNITNTSGTLSIAIATGSVFGVVKSGSNITNTAGVLSVADATTSVKGVASFDSNFFTVSAGVVSLNSNTARTNSQNTWSKAQAHQISSLSYAATITPDFSLSNIYSLTASGNFTLANPTNVVAGTTYLILITQDATGGRIATWGSNYKFGLNSVTTLSTAANKVDIISIVALSSTVLLTSIQKGF